MDHRDQNCTFIVARVDRKLVGLVRATNRLDTRFETQLYDQIHSQDIPRYFDVELARFSIVPDARNSLVGLYLIETVAKWEIYLRLRMFSAPVEPKVKSYYQAIGYHPAAGFETFRYVGDA